MSHEATPRPSPSQQTYYANLGPDSYTAQRLQHATPEHLYLTTRRCFIGPIPEGWLKDHRGEWYRHHLRINSSSKTPSFTASSNVSRQRRVTGLDGPSTVAMYGHSFPQPNDIEEEDEDADDAGATTATPPGLSIPRATLADGPVTQEPESVTGEDGVEPILEGSQPLTNTPSTSHTRNMSKSSMRKRKPRSESTGSYVTASEVPIRHLSPTSARRRQPDSRLDTLEEAGATTPEPRASSAVDSQLGLSSTGAGDDVTSRTSLLHRDDQAQEGASQPNGTTSEAREEPESFPVIPGAFDGHTEDTASRRKSGGLVQFTIPEDSRRAQLHMKARMTQMNLRRASRSIRRSRAKDGQIIKMERMLVRVDTTAEKLPDDYDENESQRVISRTAEKWREYMVVCRESTSEEAEFVLQMYKTRVIPNVEGTQMKKRSKYTIPIGRKAAKVNLYSSLDKTVVIWTPRRQGTTVYIMQARSGANAMEWYTFLRNILGWYRASELQVNVPDLDVSLRLEDPFEQLESSRDLAQASEGDDEAMLRTLQEEQAIAGKITKRCMDMLTNSPEWHDIIGAWAKDARVGLVWKRYDRLEWVHGANERKMYGTIAMMKSHDLELRPKQHYPTTVRDHKGQVLIEPAPVEGFLVRLTSHRGTDQQMGRLFWKRLYFSTHDQYLVFSRPTKALPPPPPKLPASKNAKIPTAHQIAEKIPLIYAVNPYPIENGGTTWLRQGGSGEAGDDYRRHDDDAEDEAERKAKTLLNCDGYIDLRTVVKVRKVVRGATPADENVDEGSDVDFDADVPDTTRDDGAVDEFDDDRTFELVLKNDLIIRLQGSTRPLLSSPSLTTHSQAYNVMTKKEWMRRLRALIKYWTLRAAADIALFKTVRQRNLEELGIDEETEAIIGQFARKWEVTKSHASPELYNLCGISCCRSIHISGTLYRKPRRHATFTRCSVLLCHGHLLIFQDTVRTRTGKAVAHIQHERLSSLDLRDCYLYSGLLTENDLLYRNRTFDSNKPGHAALPRIYREDGWTSTDEDVMTCFVVWHGRRKSFFRSPESIGVEEGKERTRTKLKRVSQLGVKGRSIVFKARSRAERDHWVLALQVEIERLAQVEEVRITEAEGKEGKEGKK